MTGDILFQILNKANYIAELANALTEEITIGPVEEAKLRQIYTGLSNLADDLGEFHNWEK